MKMLIACLALSLSSFALAQGTAPSRVQKSDQKVAHKQAVKAPKGREATDKKLWTDPYALPTCPISGEKLGGMGDPVVKTYNGREVRFCCDHCIKDFEADQGAAWKKINRAIAKDQLRYYPLDTCVVSGDSLLDDSKGDAVNFVYNNRLFRLCCKMCKEDIRKDPEKFVEKLDKATADAQRDKYPLDTCIVSGEKLGHEGEPAEMVVAGRLVRLCCNDCKKDILKDPAKYLAKLDKAWQAKGLYVPKADAGEAQAEHQEHAEHEDGDD
ncbi:MAG: hypothetical protein H6810_08225 [Phycisphaeraceae bacterium]|nr:MAG: hypothetical protein H6810_08225 [Phycisphaeraceae bacterium]